MSGLRQRKSVINVEEAPQRPVFKRVAAVDLFPKPKEDFRRAQTRRGAIVSLVTVVIIGLLVFWELGAYITGRDAYKTELSVDTSLSKEIYFNMDITFPRVPCHELSLDVLDVTGTFKFNVTHYIYKTPVNLNGESAFIGHRNIVEDHSSPQYDAKKDPDSPEFCGSCFLGKENEHIAKSQNACCNTCEDVMKMHDQHGLPRPEKSVVEQCIHDLSLVTPGCNYRGSFKVKKVSGTILFTPKRVGNAFMMRDVMRFDSSHIINKLSIGDERVARFSRRGVHYPLNGHQFDTGRRFSEIKYYLKVVPTTYLDAKRDTFLDSTYEYSVQWNHRHIPLGFRVLPSVAFSFDFYPIQVNNYFQRPSIHHFLVQLCGIVGGIFVVLGLIDSLVMWIGRCF
ncbi:ERGIC and golgi family 3 [Trypanosoma grayi]|uniref:ERGIC and golgi family 3 n=1 Tax=Trypanosoma grayi TaxID=71804 RepID=UPI0004F4635E|nr:ERGIC and golgi family 3 [Trypanosoma grayi]KEG12267.1 ERGIC and golgi family 3 [Trypanosoma grayi]